VEVDPLETAPREQLDQHGAAYYFLVMRRNIDNLAAKMQ